jgi:hypothetical protein
MKESASEREWTRIVREMENVSWVQLIFTFMAINKY